MENSAGQMADATEANGKTESKTAEAHTATSRESRDAEYGLTVRRSSGLTEHLWYLVVILSINLIYLTYL